jgi:hypothetical protein
MLLKTVLNNLIYNELGNLTIGKPDWADSKFNYTSLIQCVSLAYTELHKRFALKKERIVLRMLSTTTEYVLDISHADSNTASNAVKYIIDTSVKPFPNNIAKIDNIYDALGEPILFDTTKFSDLVEITDYRTIYVPNPAITTSMTLICRGLPNQIELASEADLETYDLYLAPQYLEALLLYAAGRVYVNRGAENATNNESSIFFARFEQACLNVDMLGLNVKESTSNTRFISKGFV